MSSFKIIVITSPALFTGEAERINALFDAGLWRLHIRKPDATYNDIENLIKSIRQEYHCKVVLHDYHELAIRYHLGGIHLNGRNPIPPVGYRHDSTQTISCSCHSIEEVAKKKNDFDYLSLSPIFNSISKHGYESHFTTQELMEAKERGVIDEKVYALGGVDSHNIPQLIQLGFSGAMLLGAIWKDEGINSINLLQQFL